MHPKPLNHMKCAVLLAVYNGMEYIEEQVNSILHQINIDVTIFVSIDNSTDGSERWFSALSSRDSRVIVLPGGERFFSAARNFFRLIRDVDFSPYNYIAFADQDDCWHPDKLSHAIDILHHSSFQGYSSNVTAFWPNGKKMLIDKAQPQKCWDHFFEAAGPGCTYVMRVELLTAIKTQIHKIWLPLQSVKAHDWYCYAFARANNYRWFIDAKPSMMYRQHGKNEVGVNRGIRAYYNRMKKISDGSWLKQALLIAELVGAGETPFIKKWAKLGRRELFWLAKHAFQVRRKKIEQFFFLLVCLLLALTSRNQ